MAREEGTTQQPTASPLDTPGNRLDMTGVEQFVLTVAPGTSVGSEETSAQVPPANNAAPEQAAPAQPSHPGEHPGDNEDGELKFRRLQVKASHLEKEKAALAQANAAMAKKLEELKTEEDRATADTKLKEIDQQLDGFTAEENKKALDRISALDPDDPTHADQVSKVWAEFHGIVRRKERELFTVVPPAPPASPSQETQDDTTPAAYQEKIVQALDQAGIPAEDPVFQHYAGIAPVEANGAPLSFDDQVRWAIENTTKYKAAERSKVIQEADQPLGRGSFPPPSGRAPNTPVSLDSALEAANARRRVE